MPKFKVSLTEVINYEEAVIDAPNKDRAGEIYTGLLNSGDIKITKTNSDGFSVEEL